MNCIYCNVEIPEDRAEFLVQSNKEITCVNHSQEKKKLVLMDYGHKTAGVAVVIGSDPEQQRLALRAYRRAR